MDKFAELRAFTHVMDHGGFTAAAEALGMSKAAVSKNVAALERRLGLKLFERTTRQVRPTTEGNHYYRWTRQLLAEADWADTCARALAEPHEPSFSPDHCTGKDRLPATRPRSSRRQGSG